MGVKNMGNGRIIERKSVGKRFLLLNSVFSGLAEHSLKNYMIFLHKEHTDPNALGHRVGRKFNRFNWGRIIPSGERLPKHQKRILEEVIKIMETSDYKYEKGIKRINWRDQLVYLEDGEYKDNYRQSQSTMDKERRKRQAVALRESWIWPEIMAGKGKFYAQIRKLGTEEEEEEE
jgi:hypothetical protein